MEVNYNFQCSSHKGVLRLKLRYNFSLRFTIFKTSWNKRTDCTKILINILINQEFKMKQKFTENFTLMIDRNFNLNKKKTEGI